MADLNVMLLEHARSGLNTQLQAATTDGNFDEVKRINAELVKLEVAALPPAVATAYGEKEIRAELDKLDWFGTDPKRSARTVELGKTMNPKKFSTAAEFAAALVKIVDEEFKKPGTPAGETEDDENGEAEDGENGRTEPPAKPGKQRATDGPSDADTGANRTRRTSGPWVKLSDAPADIQKEINRTADKWAPKTKDGREKYMAAALGAQYTAYKIRTGKK